MKKLLKNLISNLGYDLVRKDPNPFSEYQEFLDIYNECKEYTMTSIERMYALYKSVEYIVKNDIPGDLIECGVWRGGSSMLIAKTLQKFHCTDRQLYLFDTFEGMNTPTNVDIDRSGSSAQELLQSHGKDELIWCYAGLPEVEKNMRKTGYPAARTTFVQGKVEDTLPGFVLNGKLSLLRLDTDWYESTKIEMNYLFPYLERGGVLIIDDYGHWQGARKAIDEYMAENNLPILLNRIDYTGRIAVKV